MTRLLTVYLISIATFSCKTLKNEEASLKDIAAFDGDQMTLYYLDNENNKVVKADCPKLSVERSKVSGFDLRKFCKDNIASIPLQDFRNRLKELFLLRSGKKSLNQTEIRIFEYTIDRLSKGPQDETGFEKNRGANAIDVKNRRILDPNIVFGDPVFKHIFFEMASEIKSVFTDNKPQSDRNTPAPLPKGDIELQPVPGDHTPILVDDDFNLGSAFYLQGTISINSSSSYNGVAVGLRASDGKKCDMNVYSVNLKSDNNEIFTLYRSPEGKNNFYLPDLKRRKFTAVRLGIINHGEQTAGCQIRVVGLHYGWKSESVDWSQIEVSASNRDQVMREMMGHHLHRLNHYIWHAARNIWLLPSTTNSDRRILADLGFRPPRPIIYHSSGAINREASARSGAGEDFLFMHRVMIRVVASRLGKHMYTPWTRIPDSRSKDFPIYLESPMISSKSEEGFKQMLDWQRKYTNPNYLRSVSLSQMGIDIEFDIHNSMHMRYSRPQIEARSVAHDPLRRTNINGPWMWNNLKYDHLSDSYSAHVNPIFWRIHGWVDQRIEDWLRVHGYEKASSDCAGDRKCYNWKGRWLGVKSWIEHGQNEDGVRPSGHHHQISHDIPDFNEMPRDLARRLSENSFMFTRESATIKK